MSDILTISREEIIDNKWERILNFFRRRSLWMLYYCTGCGAIELPPSMTSRFDMERFGMGPMATPRQADILLITGYISLKTLKRVVRSYEQMPEPKWVVGFGSCPVNGGIYWDSYATINHLEKYIPVDLNIAGCMPRPQAVLDSFLTLMDMIDRGEAVGYKKYKLNYDWYKKNQDEVLNRKKPVFPVSEPRRGAIQGTEEGDTEGTGDAGSNTSNTSGTEEQRAPQSDAEKTQAAVGGRQ